MAAKSKITNFFSHVDQPLPIRWIQTAEPPKKKPKRGPGRPRKPAVVVIDTSDSEQENEQPTELQPEADVEATKTRRVYTIQQKKRIVAYAKKHSVMDAHRYFSVPRTTINRWMEDGYFQRDTTKRGTKRGAGRSITYGGGLDEQLLAWLLEARDKQLPITI